MIYETAMMLLGRQLQESINSQSEKFAIKISKANLDKMGCQKNTVWFECVIKCCTVVHL